MSWIWQYEDASGQQVGTSDPFPSQADAETWVGMEFEDLLGRGVEQVTLVNEGEKVYGPMGLRPA